MKWEQKAVGQTLKTLFVNSCIAWRIVEKKDLVDDGEMFQSLNFYRQSLNSVDSLSDFCFEASAELLRYADTLDQPTTEHDMNAETDDVENIGEEAAQLTALAVQRKRNRLSFFNSSDGMKLRLRVSGHRQKQMRNERWCALCGMNNFF